MSVCVYVFMYASCCDSLSSQFPGIPIQCNVVKCMSGAHSKSLGPSLHQVSLASVSEYSVVSHPVSVSPQVSLLIRRPQPVCLAVVWCTWAAAPWPGLLFCTPGSMPMLRTPGGRNTQPSSRTWPPGSCPLPLTLPCGNAPTSSLSQRSPLCGEEVFVVAVNLLMFIIYHLLLFEFVVWVYGFVGLWLMCSVCGCCHSPSLHEGYSCILPHGEVKYQSKFSSTNQAAHYLSAHLCHFGP